jgi:hypothetical protein
MDIPIKIKLTIWATFCPLYPINIIKDNPINEIDEIPNENFVA